MRYPDDDAPPRADELHALAGDVAYELDMFRWAAKQLLDDAFDNDLERNALVEVLQLHQRNLVAFFDGVRTKDDVIAQDYAPGWSPRGEAWEWLQDRQRSAHKRLAHVTAYRRRVPKTVDAKDVRDIGRHLTTVWADFLSEVSSAWPASLG